MTDRAPERWKYVPEEPTQAMLDTVCSDEPHDRVYKDDNMRAIYKDMLAAAPSPPALSGEADFELLNWLRTYHFYRRGDEGPHHIHPPELDKAASLIERQARELAEARAALK